MLSTIRENSTVSGLKCCQSSRRSLEAQSRMCAARLGSHLGSDLTGLGMRSREALQAAVLLRTWSRVLKSLIQSPACSRRAGHLKGSLGGGETFTWPGPDSWGFHPSLSSIWRCLVSGQYVQIRQDFVSSMKYTPTDGMVLR